MGRRRERGWPEAPEALAEATIDNHTHLETIPDVVADGVPAPSIAEELARAGDVGVRRVVQIGCDLDSAEFSVRAAREHTQILAGLAIHPNEAVLHAGIREVAPDGLDPAHAESERHELGLDEAISRIEELIRAEPRVRLVGETGLDFFRSGERGRVAQRESFRAHIALAKELGLPLQVHDRDAHAEVLEVLDADGPPEATVFHCFSGDVAFALECVARGWWLSFAGPVTYPKNDALREAARVTPLSRLLVETDAGYLTPHPFRGRPNAPYLLPLTVRAIAQAREREEAEVALAARRNAEALYGPW